MPLANNARYTPVAAPGPLPGRMVASIPQLRTAPTSWLQDSYRRYGDVVALPMDNPAAVVCHHPQAASDVLVKHADVCTKETIQYRSLMTLTGVGLLTSDGAAWREPRRILQPAFHRPRLAAVAASAVTQARIWATQWAAAGIVDAEVLALRATMGVVAHTLLGSSQTVLGDKLVSAVLDALPVVVRRSQLPTPMWLPTPDVRALKRANRELDLVCAEVIAHGQAHRKDVTGTVLGLLLDAYDAGELTNAQMRAEIVTMIIAGHETVATSLTWTLGLLGHHSAAQRAVHTELDQVLAGRAPTIDDVPRLPVTYATICESLRLYPPAWAISRRTTTTLDVHGTTLPANTVVVLSPLVMGRRADFFDDPERFNPQRFMVPLTATQRAAFMPFGAGRRMCIGKDFALTEQTLMVAELLRQHRVESTTLTGLPGVVAEVTIRPAGGMWLGLTPRV